MLRTFNPKVILNSRIQGYGDYATPEQGVPIRRPDSQWWELCMTMNDSWGYAPTDTNYKTANMLLRTFVDCISNGGNLLLDIGPKEDGTIPQEQVDILKEFGRWTKKHECCGMINLVADNQAFVADRSLNFFICYQLKPLAKGLFVSFSGR